MNKTRFVNVGRKEGRKEGRTLQGEKTPRATQPKGHLNEH
jgi:hypothetical protein